MPDFCHLHCHTQYSLLDGAANIPKMIAKAKEDQMKGVAITDHGNMFGVFQFVAEAQKQGVKPIIGCEFYLVDDRHQKEFTRDKRDKRYHQLLLAKNPQGYKNLSKLASLGFIEGLYSKYPRIDKELLLKYHEGLIATTCCIGAEIPQAILRKGPDEAEKIFKWYLDVFGEDYYVELQRHNLTDIDGSGLSQEDVNQVLIGFANKYNVKIIATNDSHYINQNDAEAHDILLCINTGERQSTPIGEGKGYRFGFANDQFFFKTQAQMGQLFHDLPQALDNTQEIVTKVEDFKLKRDILMPNFALPNGFTNQDDYLRHLTYQGAKQRYGTITPQIEERINLELRVIADMGFPGYFLIVQDFIQAAKDLQVAVGPGRGSAAGSIVAYATGITNIDPIKYSLLFERFLNPERVSMPDIDIDFDDRNRQRVIDYVVQKYGRNQVAQIITYGTMGPKMAIRDVSRVMDIPLNEADQLAKMIPEKPGLNFEKSYEESSELKEIRNGTDHRATILKQAEVLEGSVRNSGTHAAGVIIAPDDITDYIPVCTAKDADLLVTQFDGKVVEDAGMLKMDFLGLKTLTIINDAIELIERNHDVKIDPDQIPLDDQKTLELFSRGDTIGVFQFESDGMSKNLKLLKPTNIEDLIAMNALYRPGPMDNIPSFIRRKHGEETIEYPHELLTDILKPTYGIMVYQEQIMQTAQILAGYSLGAADILRRAMGKKKIEEMDRQKVIFVEGAAQKHNIPAPQAEAIFDTMAKFASYGFNRSHAAAYSVVAFQTAYLKAHYPAEYMSAVLSHNMASTEKITFFIEESRRQNIPVLGPDINESLRNFAATPKGEIRFGLAGIKGTGDAAVEAIITEREQNGPFTDQLDMAKRLAARGVTRKTLEGLAQTGAFDNLCKLNRAQWIAAPEGQDNYCVQLIKWGQKYNAEKNNNQQSLFGLDDQNSAMLPPPTPPDQPPMEELEKLTIEFQYLGIYLSGHPLDQYRLEIESLCNCSLTEVPTQTGRRLKLAGIVTAASEGATKRGDKFGRVTLEDMSGSLSFAVFSKKYLELKPYLQKGNFLYITGAMEENYRQDGMEFRIQTAQLLSEMKGQAIKGISLEIDLKKLTYPLVQELFELANQNQGNCRLYINFKDEANNALIKMLSKTVKVDASNDLITKLARLDGVTYSIEKARV